MIKELKTIAIVCLIWLVCALGLASTVENNARLAAAELVLKHRNDVVQQFSYEREAMKEYVAKAIDRKIKH